ncbi:MAG: helix-turn-helix transcriptional regulator [Nitrospirae bacterium]|nr:helix-turn-helix transcriptional regulator [Candidatus Troglogloeales bacterium]
MRGITQEHLAEKAGLHAKYVGQIERGEINTTIQTLAKVADALGVNISELFICFQKGKNGGHKATLLKEIAVLLMPQNIIVVELVKKILVEIFAQKIGTGRTPRRRDDLNSEESATLVE